MNTGPFIALLAIIAVIGGGIGSTYAVVTEDDAQAPTTDTRFAPGQGFGGQIPGEGPQSGDGTAPGTDGTGPGFGGGQNFAGGGGNILSGTVVSIEGGVLTIETAQGQQTVTLTSETTVVTTSSVEDARDQLTPGTQVSAIGPTAADGTTTVARLTLGDASGGFGGGSFGAGGFGSIAGTVASLDGNTLVIDTSEGLSSVLLTEDTTVVIQSSVDDARDELVDTEVTVVAQAGEDGELTAVVVATGVGGFGGFGGGGRVPGGGQRLP